MENKKRPGDYWGGEMSQGGDPARKWFFLGISQLSRDMFGLKRENKNNKSPKKEGFCGVTPL